jgi:hypothetical protein
MNCHGCGAPLNGAVCSFCGTAVTNSSAVVVEIEVTSAIKRQGLEDVAEAVIGDGSDLDAMTHRLEDQVQALWDAGELKKADSLIRVFSKRLPRHDKINLMLARTSYFFAQRTIKQPSNAHIAQRYLNETRGHLDSIIGSALQNDVSDLKSKIASIESKTITAFTVWDDDDPEVAAAKQSMEGASYIGTIIGVVVAVIFGGLILLGMLAPYFK